MPIPESSVSLNPLDKRYCKYMRKNPAQMMQAISRRTLKAFFEWMFTTTCFLCLGEQSLPFEYHPYKFASPEDLTKHFKRKHRAHIKEGDWIGCKVY